MSLASSTDHPEALLVEDSRKDIELVLPGKGYWSDRTEERREPHEYRETRPPCLSFILCPKRARDVLVGMQALLLTET